MVHIVRNTFLFITFYLVAHSSFGQANYDVSTKFFLAELAKENVNRPSSNFITSYDLIKINGAYHIGALTKVNNMLSRSALADLGIIVSTELEDLWTMRIPLENIEAFLALEGIDFVEISSEISPDLDRALTSARVDSVHLGLGGLDQAYFGTGVVIAIIDWGFDYTHPNFYDTTLSYLRLSRAWDQNKLSGPAPAGYTFGTEYHGSEALLEAQEDTLYVFGPGSHGTHVAGIAGGSGSGVIDYGAAPDAELLFISLRRDAPSLIDAFSYVTNYAASVNKPYVVNMSFGSHLGPHDGTSLKNYGIDILNGPGKIFVGSAGNNGGNLFHLDRDFSENNDTLKTVVNFDTSHPESFGQTLTMWGSAYSDFSASLMLVDASNNIIYESPYYYSNLEPSLDEIIEFGDDTLHIKMQSIAQQFLNNKPNIRFEVKNQTAYKVVLRIHSEDSHVHLWNNVRLTTRYTNWGVSLTANYPDALGGNDSYGLGEPAGVGKNVITVASYVPELYTNDDNFLYGTISGFSSKGPTVDLRTKPDIASTGQNIMSSVNSFDPTNSSSIINPVEFSGRTYGFSRFSGTSMSGPMVAGIVALMLESFPTMSATQAKEILRMTARLDHRTGDIDPEVGTLNWGWGKANALAAILAAKTLSSIPEVELHETFFNVYPNPASDIVNIVINENNNSKDINLIIVNMEGRMVKEVSFNTTTEMSVNINDLADGLYIFQLQVGNSFSMNKVKVSR